jgi:hypothetical protein
MSQKIKVMTTASLGLCLLVFGLAFPAAAQTDETPDDAQTTQIMRAEEQLTDEQRKQLRERLQARKDALKLRLSSTEKARLQTKCQAAQGAISSVQGRIKGIQTSRTQVYGHLTERLTDLSEKLKAKGVDTTEFDAAIAELNTHITAFNTALTEYIQAVTDLALMQCSDDVEGFKASLEEARELQQELRDSGVAIKTFLNERLKPILTDIRSQLAENSTDDNEEDGE